MTQPYIKVGFKGYSLHGPVSLVTSTFTCVLTGKGQKKVISVEVETEFDKFRALCRQCMESATAEFMRSLWRRPVHMLRNGHGHFNDTKFLEKRVWQLVMLRQKNIKGQVIAKERKS